ncbi:MAG: DUF92 domain-containing protein [Caldilineaceae bacterium]
MTTAQQTIFAFFTSIIIVLLARRRGWLSRSGAAGAVLVGTLVFGLGGWAWGTPLIAFFISSSLLSRLRSPHKTRAAQHYDKSHARDLMQVLANGGAGSLAALGNLIWPSPLWYAFFMGAMATVNADTWATELGALNRQPPRLITTGKLVAAGTSGGISVIGTLAALAGALFIGAVAGLFDQRQFGNYIWVGGSSGLIGALCDSMLGATVQCIYFDDELAQETEKSQRAGQPLRPVRGWPWMTNDMVNLGASIVGGLIGLLLLR